MLTSVEYLGRYIPVAVIFLTMFFSTFAAGNGQSSDFKEYSVPVYQGPIAPPDFSSLRYSDNYKTKITASVKSGVNFAGQYTIVTIGCGTSCTFSYMVNDETGKILHFPLGGDRNYMLQLDYKRDSRLLKASWIDVGKENSCVLQDYLVKHGQFVELRKTINKMGRWDVCAN